MHRNAPLTVEGRRRLYRRIEEDDFSIAQAAESMNISRQTASRSCNRYRVSGIAGLEDRPRRPRRSLARTSARLERRVVALATERTSTDGSRPLARKRWRRLRQRRGGELPGAHAD